MDVYARRRLVAGLAIVLVLVLIGVAIAGGGDDNQQPSITAVDPGTTPDPAAPLTHDQFIEQGDAICAEANASIANLSSDDPERLAEDELSITESELDSLRSLVPPERDQAVLDDFFRALEDLVDSLDKRLLAIQRNDDAAASEADTQITTGKEDLLAAAGDYGFKDCGAEGEPTNTGDPTGTGGEAVAPTTPPATTPPATTPPPVTTPPATTPPPASGGGSGGTGSGGISP